jgi:hypothetical protein
MMASKSLPQRHPFCKGGLLILSLLLSGLQFCSFAQPTRISIQSGNWTTKGTWDCNCVPAATDNAVIGQGHTVTFVATNTVNDLIINDGGVISDNGLTNTINGNFIVNGTYSGSGIVNLNGSSKNIGGTGTISNTNLLNITGDKVIQAGSDLSKASGNIVIKGLFTVTNNGTFTTGGSIIGESLSSTWTNGAGATLNVGGTLLSVSPGGILNSSAIGNTINYFGIANFTIKLPSLYDGLNTYHNLIISGSGTKTLPNGNVAVNGDLTINSTLSGNGASKILHVRGNWMNNGGFTPGYGTVVFDGTVNQTLSNSSVEDFHNLTINKSTGKLILESDIIVASNTGIVGTTIKDYVAGRSTLTMMSGDIDTGIKSITIGRTPTDSSVVYTGKISWNSGRIIGKLKRWIAFDWISDRRYYPGDIVYYLNNWYQRVSNNNNTSLPTTSEWTALSFGELIFPVGTESGNRNLTIDFVKVNSGLLTVNFESAYPGNTGLPKTDGTVTVYNTFRDGYWVTKPEAGLSSNVYHVNLMGDGMTSIFTIDADTRIVYRPDQTFGWDLLGNHGLYEGGNNIKRDNLNTLSAQWALADKNNCASPLAKSIVGETQLCSDEQDVAYAISGTIGNSYSWSVIGGIIQGGNGVGTSSSPSILSGVDLTSITVDWGNSGGAGIISVTEGVYCALPNITLVGPENILNVIIRPEVFSIAGKVNVPQNGSNAETYSVNAPAGYDNLWSVVGGVIQGSNNGVSINVLWGNAGVGEVTITSLFEGCSTTSQSKLAVKIYSTISSLKSGTWVRTPDNASNRSLWDCNCIPGPDDNITIRNTHIVTVGVNNGITANNVTIEAGGELRTGSGITRKIIVKGDLNLFGTLSGSTSPIDLVAGSSPNTLIDGNGTISNGVNFNIHANRTIFSRAALVKANGNVVLGAGVRVRNNGTFSVGGDIVGMDASSEWINLSGSILEIADSLLSTGIVDASANNNLIRYSGSVIQNVKVPRNNQYNNIIFAGTGSKVLPDATILISGNLSNDSPMNSGNGIVDFNGSTIISGSLSPIFNSVKISGTLISAADSIKIKGNFDKAESGIFIHNRSTILFNGSALQQVDAKGSDFYNIAVKKSSGALRLESALNLISVLIIQSSTQVQSNGHLILKSTGDDPDTTATIAAIPVGASVTGDVTVHRYMSGEGRIYRYLSSPVTNATVAAWIDNFSITGTFSGASPAGSTICGLRLTRNPSMYWYNETVPGDENAGYVPFPTPSTGSINDLLVPGRGYAAFIRNCDAPTLIDVSGPINQGSFSFSNVISFSDVTNGPAEEDGDGWNLVGNPYPAPIRWGVDNWTMQNISDQIAIRDNATGNFYYYDRNEADGVIAIGQAFWIRAFGTPALIVHEQAKAIGVSHSFYRKKSSSDLPFIEVALSNGSSADKALIKQRPEALNELDQFDAPKLRNFGFGIATKTGQGKAMAVNVVPTIYEGMDIPLRLDSTKTGNTYVVIFSSSEDFSNYSIELTDKEQGIRRIMNWNEPYSFLIGNDISENRFTARLIAHQPSETQVLKLVAYPNPVQNTLHVQLPPDGMEKRIELYDAMGVKLNEFLGALEGEQIEISFNSRPNGVYLIRLVGSGYNQWTKVIKGN